MKNPTHTYKGRPVKLLELTYEANGWQYGTIEMVNKTGRTQMQTVQVRNLTPLAPNKWESPDPTGIVLPLSWDTSQ